MTATQSRHQRRIEIKKKIAITTKAAARCAAGLFPVVVPGNASHVAGLGKLLVQTKRGAQRLRRVTGTAEPHVIP